jgi:hypothetical protein
LLLHTPGFGQSLTEAVVPEYKIASVCNELEKGLPKGLQGGGIFVAEGGLCSIDEFLPKIGQRTTRFLMPALL